MTRTLLAISLCLAAPASALAFGAGIGCTNLPEHDRAVGALEGMTGACDMSVEQARRILAQDAGPSPAAAPRPRRHRLRHARQP